MCDAGSRYLQGSDGCRTASLAVSPLVDRHGPDWHPVVLLLEQVPLGGSSRRRKKGEGCWRWALSPTRRTGTERRQTLHGEKAANVLGSTEVSVAGLGQGSKRNDPSDGSHADGTRKGETIMQRLLEAIAVSIMRVSRGVLVQVLLVSRPCFGVYGFSLDGRDCPIWNGKSALCIIFKWFLGRW